MSSTSNESETGTDVARRSNPNSPLVSEHGTTTIADGVVAKIAGLAAREINGVHALGGGTSRAIGALRDRLPGGRASVSQGVSVVVNDTEAAVEVDIIAEYGVAIADLAAGIRRNVISSVERMTGMDVTTVDIDVLDIHLPQEDDDSGSDESTSSS